MPAATTGMMPASAALLTAMETVSVPSEEPDVPRLMEMKLSEVPHSGTAQASVDGSGGFGLGGSLLWRPGADRQNLNSSMLR